MKKLTAILLAMLMVVSMTTAFAGSAAPDWKPFDELITEIKAATDFVEREALMHKAEDMLMETNAIVPLYFYNDIFMSKPEFTGHYTNAYGMKHFEYATNGEKTSARLNLASEPDKLDPALNSSVDGACLAIAAFGGLYAYDKDAKLVPNLATGHTVSEDGLTYVFDIREGLKWSDGVPIDAKDFEYSWNRLVAKETAADYAYMAAGIKGYEEGELAVSASEDGKQFTVELIAPCSYMLDLAAFPAFYIVPKHAVEAAEGYKEADGTVINPGAWAQNPGFPVVGPYQLTAWDHDVSMTYTKNPNYYDAENVKLETLEFMLTADTTVAFAAYKAGDLDFIDGIPTDEIVNVIESPEFYNAPQLGTYFVIFNVNSPLFDGKTPEQANAMRKAFSLMIDRDYIVETIGQTGQKPANAFIPEGMADGHGGIFKTNDEDYKYPSEEDKGYHSLKYNPDEAAEQAIELLKSAGYEFENGKLSANTPINFEYLTNTSDAHEAIAQAIQQDLGAIGITLTVKSIDWKVFLNERKSGNYDVARHGWIADFDDPINMLEMWVTDSGNNDAQFGR